MLSKRILATFLLIGFIGVTVRAEQEKTESDELDVIELELDKSAAKKPSFNKPTQNAPENKSGPSTLSDFKDLGSLAPFNSISVIQKRFMPKTGRMQLFAGPTLVTNDPFFNTFGAAVKASYFLNETWGVETNYFGLSTTETQSTSELRSINKVKAESLAYPISYLGADLVYVPIYGKMSWFNKKIIPFDLYFSAGYGNTEVSNGEQSGTVHVATGQIYSLSKSVAFRWDFSWNFYDAIVVDKNNVKGTSSLNNLFLTVGLSWFFPEAGYR